MRCEPPSVMVMPLISDATVTRSTAERLLPSAAVAVIVAEPFLPWAVMVAPRELV